MLVRIVGDSLQRQLRPQFRSPCQIALLKPGHVSARQIPQSPFAPGHVIRSPRKPLSPAIVAIGIMAVAFSVPCLICGVANRFTSHTSAPADMPQVPPPAVNYESLPRVAEKPQKPRDVELEKAKAEMRRQGYEVDDEGARAVVNLQRIMDAERAEKKWEESR